jgi:putative ATPase
MARRRDPQPAGPSLFEAAERRGTLDDGPMPLAERVRPESIDEVQGQQHLLGQGKPLARAIDADRVPSMILWGPPGTGKTTLARVIAARTRARFVAFSAVLGGVAELRRIVGEAADRRRLGGERTVLFVDEIHRFNRAQQDAFLPHVERGTVVLVGATTENPSFALNAPLLSRCTVYRLESLDGAALRAMLQRALAHPLGYDNATEVDDDALDGLVELARGDGRKSLGLLELAIEQMRHAGEERLTRDRVEALATHKTLLYDKAGDEHYDVISAFIKSLRGSDPDAAIYWMMRMLEAGDDPLYILRRMLIFAGEDIGVADPRALMVATSADQAFRRLGMPEGMYAMAQAALYLACAPKSNAATLAWKRAKEAVEQHGALPVPSELRNAPTKLARQQGHGVGYRYPHDEAGGVAMGAHYLPDELRGARYYQPTDRGVEGAIAARLASIRAARDEATADDE